MSGKKKKKRPSDELVKTFLGELKSSDEKTRTVLPLGIDDSVNESQVSQALLGVGAIRTAINKSAYQDDRDLPEGLESKTAVFKSGEAPSSSSEKTQVVHGGVSSEATQATQVGSSDSEKTVVVNRGARPGYERSDEESKTSFGVAKPSTRAPSQPSAFGAESQIAQAEALKMAQDRIIGLEKELEKLREENELLSSASDLAREKSEDLMKRLQLVEREKAEQYDQAQAEMNIYRDSMNEKDHDLHRLRKKVEDLEGRLKADLKKIRVRERELENRLELMKMEKSAIVRSKDESILELKRQVDSLSSEVEDYKARCQELGQKIEANHEQLSRTVRALRLALTNLEVNENTSGSVTLTPFKKAE